MRILVRCLVALLLATAAGRAQTTPVTKGTDKAGEMAAAVDKLFERFDRKDSPGCALGIVRDGRVIYRRGYGMADLDHDVPITPYSVFHVASVSKQFTAAAVALLAQQGKLSLDDEVRKHLPEVPRFAAPITVRQLIHHTSGLRDQWSLLGLAGWRYSLDLITDDDVLDMISRQKELNFTPGERHLYSNSGYTLLSLIVKKVSGKSLREFTRDEFFRPLGMESTHFRDDHAEIVKHMAYGYTPRLGTFRQANTNFDTVGATSLLTTVDDLALWDQNFYDKRVGGPSLIEKMHERGKLNNGEQISYAFGLTIGNYKGLPVVEHAGGDAGYRSHLMRFPEQRFSVACLCNAATANPVQFARQVADLHLKGLLKEDPKRENSAKIEIPAELAKTRAGLYLNRESDNTGRISLKEGKPYLEMGSSSWALEGVDEQRWRVAAPEIELRFENAAGASRSALLVSFGGGKPDRFEPAEEFAPAASQLQEYSGTYFSEEAEAFYRVAVDGDKLILKRLRHRPATLQPTAADLFTGPVGNMRFTRAAGGSVEGIVINSGRIRGFKFKKQ